MAKKKAAVNKSQAIRDYSAKNGESKPAAVVAALKKQGITVTAQQVSTVRFNDKKKPKKKGRAGDATAKRTGSAEKVSVTDLLAAKAFSEKVGGVAAAGTLLAALKKLDA